MSKSLIGTIAGLFTFVLLSCTPQTVNHGDGLIVKASRHWTLPPRSYVIDVSDGTEISGMKPRRFGDNPDLSPDGEWIAFDTQYIDGFDQSQIYLARWDDGRPIQVTYHDGGSFSPTWFPDGSQIAYEASGKIYLLDVACVLMETNCDFTPKLIASGMYPSWAPDGKHLVYVDFGYGLRNDRVLVINAHSTENSVDITPPNSSYCRYPEWAPDQTKIVVSCDGQIYVVMADGSSVMRVGEGDYPRWSPLGNKIAFVSDRDSDLGKPLDFEGSITSNAIYIMDADGSNIQRITNRNDESILWFVWFPRK